MNIRHEVIELKERVTKLEEDNVVSTFSLL